MPGHDVPKPRRSTRARLGETAPGWCYRPPVSRLPLAAVAVAAALSAACAVDAFSGDPFPIAIDRDSGAVMVHIRREAQDAGVAVPAVLDVMAPITVLDPGRDGPA